MHGRHVETWEPFLRPRNLLKSAMTPPSRDITCSGDFWLFATQISKAGSPPVVSGKAEHYHSYKQPGQRGPWRPSRSHPGGMEECLHVPGWLGTAMASHMRSDRGLPEGSTSLKKHSCRKVPPSKEYDEVSPGGDVSHCREGLPCWVCIKGHSSSQRRGWRQEMCMWSSYLIVKLSIHNPGACAAGSGMLFKSRVLFRRMYLCRPF